MSLTPSQAKIFYDRFGSKQDSQAFYEDAAFDDLIAHGKFDQAKRVFELGCGTGRFASRLLSKQLPPSASYLGIDLSHTMIALAKQRLAPFSERAKVQQSDGSMYLQLSDHSVDFFVSTYVFDLLSDQDISYALNEAHRVLKAGGKLCLISLTDGVTPISRLISALWSMIYHLRASLVGGCRPIRLASYLDHNLWSMDYRNVVVRFGIPSEILIARSNRTINPDSHGLG